MYAGGFLRKKSGGSDPPDLIVKLFPYINRIGTKTVLNVKLIAVD